MNKAMSCSFWYDFLEYRFVIHSLLMEAHSSLSVSCAHCQASVGLFRISQPSYACMA